MEGVGTTGSRVADTENRMKTGDKFYKMDEDSIVTIREELSEDFFALAEEHLKEIRGFASSKLTWSWRSTSKNVNNRKPRVKQRLSQ